MSSFRCAVCGRSGPEVREWLTVDGTRYGMACRGECAGLLWEAHFVKATGAGEYELAVILWQWQRRRAEVEGIAFVLPYPKTQAEAQLERWAASLPQETA